MNEFNLESLSVTCLDRPMRIIDDHPHTFRVAEYPDGRKIIQGAYAWHAGFSEGGVVWRDLPAVKVDESGRKINE